MGGYSCVAATRRGHGRGRGVVDSRGLTCRVCAPKKNIASVRKNINHDHHHQKVKRPVKVIAEEREGPKPWTYKITGVARGGGVGRGLATLHRGLDGSRPIEQATGSTTSQSGREDEETRFTTREKSSKDSEKKVFNGRRGWREENIGKIKSNGQGRQERKEGKEKRRGKKEKEVRMNQMNRSDRRKSTKMMRKKK